jgi:pyruvate/2-oxoglutarate dehydrogenase complex dihydrolipoamide dehydrogenase (E3) component
MRTWRNLSKLAAVGIAAASLALTGTSAAVAGQNASALTCGGDVFLDGLRALQITENGHDEVYITTQAGAKVWPVTADYVSIAAGQRVEVDKCVAPNAVLYLWEEDTLDVDDYLGVVAIDGDRTKDYLFSGGPGLYRIGAVA